MPKLLETPRLLCLALIAAFVLLATPLQAQKSRPGEFRFGQASYNVPEDVGFVTVEVRRHNGSTGDASVELVTIDGSAAADSDYIPVTTTLSWLDGDDASQFVDIEILDDDESERLENFRVVLQNESGASLHRQRFQTDVKILPSDQSNGGGTDEEGEDPEDPEMPPGGSIAFDQRTYQSSESAGLAVVTVRRRGGDVGAVSVDVTTRDGKAIAPDDYEQTLTTLTWEDGDTSVQSFTVPIVDDSERERTENFYVELDNVQGDAAIYPDRGTASVLIHDNDQLNDDPARAGLVRFVSAEYQVIEGRPFAEIRVERLYGKQQPVSVDYETQDASAEAGSDYEAVSGTLLWAQGDPRVKVFQIPILDDDEEEENEVVLLSLLNPAGGAEIAPDGGEASLYILDDDGESSTCTPTETVACLQGGRFEVTAVWRTDSGESGEAQVLPLSRSSTLFWFFEIDNVEMLVKVLDGCAVFDAYWVFYAATTDVDFTLRVTDTVAGVTKEYTNMLGEPADAVTDTITFTTCGV